MAAALLVAVPVGVAVVVALLVAVVVGGGVVVLVVALQEGGLPLFRPSSSSRSCLSAFPFSRSSTLFIPPLGFAPAAARSVAFASAFIPWGP